jgi:8-oxo-dGTP pyrophosphatase MutT (NUDIX family)
MDRHLTVSGFVVHRGRVALHWHRKLGAWLPAGGHVEPGEDPVQATLREIREEFGIEAEVIPTAPRVEYKGGPPQIEPPFTILNCRVGPDHEHVDMVYFCRLVSGYPGRSHDPDNPVEWVDEATLRAGEIPLGGCGDEVEVAPDVRALALEALRIARLAEARSGTA